MHARRHALMLMLAAAGCRRGVDQVDGTAIILVMDGVRLEESLGDDPSGATGEHPQEFMPATWSELLPLGARAAETWSIGATTTTPAHAALLAGRRLPLANYPVSEGVGLYRPELPGLFEAVRDQLEASEDQVLLVANTELLQPVERSLWPGSEGATWVFATDPDDADKPVSDDRAVIQALQEQLQAAPVRLAMVNLHQVDRSGHYGTNTAYLDDVRALDEPIVDLWSWLQGTADYHGDTTLVLISDHGRHSYSEDDPLWRHHGDNCNGCRRVPALVLGPDAAAGQDYAEPMLLADVAPTLAALLGVELPWARGLVLDALLAEPTGVASRSGVADLAVSGGLVAEIRYGDDPWHRSALWIQGQRISDPDALAVEAPALAVEGDSAWLCFRQLSLTPDDPDTAWQAACYESADGGEAWTAIAPPVEQVGALWRPVLMADTEGRLLAAYANNANTTATGGAEGGDGEVSLEVALRDRGTWTTVPDEGDQTYPTDPAAVRSGETLFMAVGAAPSDNDARHQRDVYLAVVSLLDGRPAWLEVSAADLAALAGSGSAWRLELPALRVDSSDALHLAAVGHSDAGSHAVLAMGDDAGASWSRSSLVELPYPPDPHLAPVWLGERAVWVTVDTEGEDSWLCAASMDSEPSCVRAGSPRVDALAADGDQLYVILDEGVGSWALQQWSAEELGL